MDVTQHGLRPLPQGWAPSKDPPPGYCWLIALDAFAVAERSGWWKMVRKVNGHFVEVAQCDSVDVDALRYFLEASDEWIGAVRANALV